MAEGCRPLRESLGAFVLGHLDPAQAEAVRAHLDDCADCRAEAAELAETAGLLAAAGPLRAVTADDPLRAVAPPADVGAPDGLGERVVSRVAEDRARRRRGRWRLGVAAAACVAVLALAGAAVLGVFDPGEEPLEQVVLADGDGAEATATLRPWDWGTGIELEASGLEPGGTYAVWFADADGERLSAGTFVAVDDGRVRCRLTSAMLRPTAAALGVTDVDDGTDVLETTLR